MQNKVVTENKNTDNRSDKIKLYSIGAVVLLIAILVLANVLFEKILGKALTFDFSDNLSNSLSQVSIDYLDSLPADTKIQVVGLFEKPDNISGTPYQYIIPLLDDYVKNSKGKVTVEYVDPNVNPQIINQLDPTNSFDLQNNLESFVIKVNDNIKIVSPYDCYSYDSDYLSRGYYYVIGNNTEYTLTNSMYILTQGYSCKAYVVTGLAEKGNIYLSSILEGMAIEYNELPVSENFTIPEDCDLLILNGPNSDISEKMLLAMTEYVSKNGKLLVSVNFNLNNVGERYPRLNQLLNQININVDPALISENDPWHQLGGLTIDTSVNTVDDFKDYVKTGALHSSYARSVSAANPLKSNVAVYPVLVTSENASTVELDSSGNSIAGTSIDGKQFNVCMYAVGEGSDPVKAFVFGTTNFTSDEYISAYGLNDSNVTFIKSCIRELTSTKNVSVLDVATKNVDNYTINTDKATASASTAVLIVFMILIPLALVSAAVIIYAKRKSL
ncbi:ABC transporter family protein [Ruminococcaceae bacterium R-25]|nr:ABC transporter family protein [Ruminococcaceae bacterium R-25]SUQ11211.1 ABC-type uncharacterized transport system [Oscillospiraceae bacterium]